MTARRWLGATLLLLLAAAITAASVLGPLVAGAIRYHTSATALNQIIGGDLAGLVLVAPAALVAGVLVLRGHRAGPLLGLAPALWAVYVYAQLVVGQEYGWLPGNNERFFPLLLGLFVVGQAVTVIAWRDIDPGQLPEISPRLEQTVGIVLLVLAAFLALGLHLPSLLAALSGPPRPEYASSPSAFWVVKLMDLGMIVPAAVAIGVGMLRRAAWAHKASYAIVGGYTLLSAAVAGMAMVMYLNGDPDASIANVIAFITFTAAAAWLTIRLYRPLFAEPAPTSERGSPDPDQRLAVRPHHEAPEPGWTTLHSSAR